MSYTVSEATARRRKIKSDVIYRRQSPKLDLDYHMIAVRNHDELVKLVGQAEPLTSADMTKLRQILEIMLIVEKKAPKRKSNQRRRPDPIEETTDDII